MGRQNGFNICGNTCQCQTGGPCWLAAFGAAAPDKTYSMKSVCFPALVVGAMLFGNLAQAQAVSGTMGVSASVGQSCSLSASPMAFGALTAGDTDIETTSVITLECSSNGTPTTVTLGNGDNVGTAPVRQMKSGINLIPYELYFGTTLATHDQVVAFDQAVGPTTSTFTVDITAKVTLPAGTPDGVYQDTILLKTTYTF